MKNIVLAFSTPLAALCLILTSCSCSPEDGEAPSDDDGASDDDADDGDTDDGETGDDTGDGGTGGGTGDDTDDDDTDSFPCAPVLHETQGFQANIEFQRYRFVGGSPDGGGSKTAVLYSHFGPSSQAPVVNVFGYQSGLRTPLLHHSLFMLEGGEQELLQLEEQVLLDASEDMAAEGIVPDDNLPSPIAWCMVDDVVYVEDETKRTFRWESFEEECADGTAVLQWRLCPADPGAGEQECAVGSLDPEWDCTLSIDTTVSIELWDLFAADGTLWVAAMRHVEPLGTLDHYSITLAGAEFPESQDG
jgi:hypothetical protein